MNRDDLIEKLTTSLSLQRRDVERIIEAALHTIMETLKHGEKVSLSGFGQFTVGTRSARQAANPRNPRERILVPAVRVPKFRAGKHLKEAVK